MKISALSPSLKYAHKKRGLKRDPDSKYAKRAVREGEEFLYSSWFEMLTNVDPGYIDRKLKEMVDEKY